MQSYSERLNAIAIDLSTTTDTGYNLVEEICHIASELEQFDLETREGEFPTPRQSLALGRFLGQAMRDDQPRGMRSAKVSRGGAGLSDDYLFVVLGDGYVGGIDREGRVST